jgi:hypothetical protein
MPTDRQIAANRRNARRSTGPRSAAGRKRSSRNSLRHGLAAGMTAIAERIKHIERLARKIAGAGADVVVMLGNARTVAQAAFELAQIRRTKIALISRVMVFGELEPPDALPSSAEIKRFLKGLTRGEMIVPQRVEGPAMPITETERSAEAIRRALPELIKLDRYKRRAAVRRARRFAC